MKNFLFIFLLLGISLIANTPTSADLQEAIFVNGNGEGSNKTTQVSLVVDINSTNIKQFNVVNSSLTTISETNYKYLLDKITYRTNEHPIIAKIRGSKLILVFDLVDTNDSNPSNDLEIESNIIRDGSTGGAVNSATMTLAANLIQDRTAPVLLEASTVDNDNNGYIDNIRLVFSEYAQTDTIYNTGFSVSSYQILGLDSLPGQSTGVGQDNNGTNGETFYIRLQEKTSFDTDTQPSVFYSRKTGHELQDANENNITSISSFKATDEALPVFISASAESIDNGADLITIGFSEPISKPLVLNTDITLSDGPSINGAILHYFNNDKNITIELNESITDGRGYIPSTSLEVNIKSTAKDKNGNNFSDTSQRANVILENIKPKLLSIAKLRDIRKGGYFTISFNEAMREFTGDDIELEYSGTESTGLLPAITSVAMGSNKKTATLEIENMPLFTEAETRIITLIMKSSIQDLAGNSIDENESNKSFTITKDDTPPEAINFTVNINTGEIKIDFNESMGISTFHPSSIILSREDEGNLSLTSHSKASFTPNSNQITIDMNDDIHALKSFLKDKEDFNISILTNSGIIDQAGNACASTNIPIDDASGSFVADNVSPRLLNWDFDLDNKRMILNFDEPMSIDDYNASDITLSDSNITPFDNKLTFIENKSSAKTNDKSIEITLFSSQIINILNTDDLADELNTTFIEINTNSNFKDIIGNSLVSLSDTTALRATTYKADKNKISKLNIIPNTWNHISINRPTKTEDIMASGKINHIYTYSNEIWYSSPENIDPKVGYWIKVGDHNSSTLEIPSNSESYIQGKKVDDLSRITSKTDGVFHLIGIENNLTYEEMHNFKNTACKNMRIHHYDASDDSATAGWDKNASVLENSSLWVQCVK